LIELRLSVTLMLTVVAAVAAVGVPEITPPALIDNPAGQFPAILVHVYGPMPPSTEKVKEYA
jgi:hypothetical protein